MSDKEVGAAFFGGLLLGLTAGVLLVVFVFIATAKFPDREQLMKQAIERGVAGYNEKSGQWEWKVEAEKKP